MTVKLEPITDIANTTVRFDYPIAEYLLSSITSEVDNESLFVERQISARFNVMFDAMMEITQA